MQGTSFCCRLFKIVQIIRCSKYFIHLTVWAIENFPSEEFWGKGNQNFSSLLDCLGDFGINPLQMAKEFLHSLGFTYKPYYHVVIDSGDNLRFEFQFYLGTLFLTRLKTMFGQFSLRSRLLVMYSKRTIHIGYLTTWCVMCKRMITSQISSLWICKKFVDLIDKRSGAIMVFPKKCVSLLAEEQ